uniref:Gem-associated protein 7 n=1 Tax=Eptatretus burgeri TaxID=7764 RepID=A0A8C4NH59_EPTBU
MGLSRCSSVFHDANGHGSGKTLKSTQDTVDPTKDSRCSYSIANRWLFVGALSLNQRGFEPSSPQSHSREFNHYTTVWLWKTRPVTTKRMAGVLEANEAHESDGDCDGDEGEGMEIVRVAVRTDDPQGGRNATLGRDQEPGRVVEVVVVPDGGCSSETECGSNLVYHPQSEGLHRPRLSCSLPRLVPILRLPRGPEARKGFDPSSARFKAQFRPLGPGAGCAGSTQVWGAVVEEEQAVRAMLRERFVRCLLALRGRAAEFTLYERLRMRARFSCADVPFTSVAVHDLDTPLGKQPAALLRTSDVIVFQMQLSDSEGAAG